MPTELKDLNLDEVSLVSAAANGRRFLLYKSADKKGVKMIDNKAVDASVALSKADITEIVEKAVEPIRKENAELRAVLRKKEYETIAKSSFSHLGTPEEGAEILKSLEGLPSEARKPILKALKQANAMKAEASKILYSPMGSNRPAPGSSAAQFEELVQKHMGIIEKSDKAPTDRKVLRSLAVAKATKENGALAQAVMAEERANTIKAQMGVL